MNVISRHYLRIFKAELPWQHNLCNIGRFIGYKSAYSLDKLYPTSNLKLYTPTFVPEDPKAKFTGYVPLDKVEVTYSRSSGAGGQNVNKVNTKVDLRFKVSEADWLSEEIRQKLVEQNETRLTKDGYLVVKSELTRSQQLNLADALEKLRTMIRTTLLKPSEPSAEDQELWRKRSLRAVRLRLAEKRRRSQTKRERKEEF